MEKTATLSLLSLPSFPFLICPFWTYRNFQRTHMCVSGFVHWEYRHRPHCALVLCVHCKFEKHRQYGNSNSNELVAFIIFFFSLLLFTISSLLLLLTCLCYWHHNGHCFYSTPVPIWFCLLSLLKNDCLRGNKCFEPLSQSDLFRYCSCSFIKSSSLLAVAASNSLISTNLLFTTVNNNACYHSCL